MAKYLDNLSIEHLLLLINDGNVVNFKRHSILSENGDTSKGILKRQYLLKDKTYYIYYFDSYRVKNNLKTLELYKDKFYIYLERDLELHLQCSDEKYFFDYHKQRVPKKTFDVSITDEFDIKKLVYQWLLNKEHNAVIVPEFGIGNRRADYVSLGVKNTYVVEIKSELDTFERLEEQLHAYHLIGNYVYIALHISKYQKLIEKPLNISNNVGILVIENNKLIQVKRAFKRSFDRKIFKEYVSYVEFTNAFFGFKYSSKFHKDQLVKIINNHISVKNQNDYFYEVIRHRHIKESNLRKEAFKENDLEKALGSSKTLKINRMKSNIVYSLKEHTKAIISEDILYHHHCLVIQNFYKTFKGYKNIECIAKDQMYPRILLKEFNIKLDFTNELSLYESSLSVSDKIKAIWEKFLIHCELARGKAIQQIINTQSTVVLKVSSKIEQNIMIELFEANNMTFKKVSTRDTYFNLQSYLNLNVECKGLDCILLLVTSTSYFCLNDRDGFELFHSNKNR